MVICMPINPCMHGKNPWIHGKQFGSLLGIGFGWQDQEDGIPRRLNAKMPSHGKECQNDGIMRSVSMGIKMHRNDVCYAGDCGWGRGRGLSADVLAFKRNILLKTLMAVSWGNSKILVKQKKNEEIYKKSTIDLSSGPYNIYDLKTCKDCIANI